LKLWIHKMVWIKESGLVLEMKMGWQWEKIALVLSCFDVLLSVDLLFVIFLPRVFCLFSLSVFFFFFFTHIGNHISLLQGYSLRNHQQSSFNPCGLYLAWRNEWGPREVIKKWEWIISFFYILFLFSFFWN